MKITDIKQIYKNLSEKQQWDLFIEICKSFPEVKEFLWIKYGDKEIQEKLFNNVKQKMQKEFDFKYVNSRWRSSVVKKQISEYKKITQDIKGEIDLYILYLNILTSCISEFWGWEEIIDAYYNNFWYTAKLIHKSGLQKKYKEELENIAEKSQYYWYGADAVYDFLHEFIY